MEMFYKIGGHVIGIKCNNLSVMEAMPEFSVFRIENPLSVEIMIHLEKEEPIKIEGHLYYTVKTEDTICKLYEQMYEDGMEIWQDEIQKLSVLFETKKAECFIRGDLNPVFLRFALWVVYNWTVGKLKTVAIHSSAITCREKAFLYLGESGTGKSTHTRLIHQRRRDVELLNDDSPILRMEGGKCMVYGSPWSGKTACYKQKKAELGALIRLSQAPYNHIEHLDIYKALGAFLPSFPPELYLSARHQYNMIGLLTDILECSRFFLLECLPDAEAADLSVNIVIEETVGRYGNAE